MYNAFTTPYQTNTSSPRDLVGVVKQGTVSSGVTGSWSTLNRGATGDARGSSANSQVAEFLGDYVYAAATNTFGVAVWNDTRNAQDCPAVDTYRENLQEGITPNPVPDPPTSCPANSTFGNGHLWHREITVHGKGGKTRTVKVSYDAARVLDRYLRVRARHGQAYRPQLWPGISNRDPMTASGIYQVIARRGRECGIEVFPHRFRHHFSH